MQNYMPLRTKFNRLPLKNKLAIVGSLLWVLVAIKVLKALEA